MCGRARFGPAARDYMKKCPRQVKEVREEEDVLPCIENVSPGMSLPVLVHADSSGSMKNHQQVVDMTWGLYPTYLHSQPYEPYRLFNKRIESLETRDAAAYYQALLQRGKRCVVVVDGFYEWKTIAGVKQPHYVYLAEENSHSPREIMFFAGIYEDVSKTTFSIITTSTASSTDFLDLHDRQPLLLPHDMINAWLDPTTTTADAVLELLREIKCLQPVLGAALRYHPVSTRVTSPKYQGADCSKEVKLTAAITTFFGSPSKKGVKRSSTEIVDLLEDEDKDIDQTSSTKKTITTTDINAVKTPSQTTKTNTNEGIAKFFTKTKK